MIIQKYQHIIITQAEFVEDFLVMPPIDDATLDGDQQPLAPQQVSIDLTPRQLLYEQLDVERRAPMPVEDVSVWLRHLIAIFELIHTHKHKTQGDFGENILNLPPMAVDVGVGTVTFDGYAAEESVTLLDPAGDPEPSSLPAPDALAPPVIEPVRPTVRGRRRRPRRVRRADDSDYAAPPRVSFTTQLLSTELVCISLSDPDSHSQIPRLPTTVEIESDLLEGIRRQVSDNLNARSSVVAMATPNNAVEPDSYHRRSTGDVANVRNDGIATAPRLPPVIGDFDITHEAITPHVETNDAFVPHVNAIEAIVPQIVIDADDVPMPNVSDAFPMPLRPTTPPPHPPAALLDTTTINQAQPPLSPMVLLCPLSQQLMSTPLPVPPQREPSPVGDSNAAQRAQRSGNVDNGTLQYAEVLLQVPDTPMRMLYTKRCSVSLESMADDRRAEEQATRTSASRLVRAMRSSNVPLRAGPLLRSVTASRTAELPTNSVSVRQAFQTICSRLSIFVSSVLEIFNCRCFPVCFQTCMTSSIWMCTPTAIRRLSTKFYYNLRFSQFHFY